MKRIGDSKEPTIKQAHNILANLREKYPDKSFSIDINLWNHSHNSIYTEYSLAILPGFDGSNCQRSEDFKDWPPFLKYYRKVLKEGIDV